MSCCLHDACKDKAGELGFFGNLVVVIVCLVGIAVVHYCF